MKKRIKANIYTKGKFGRRFRETLDLDNPYLYSHGRYATKITAEDLPEDYVEIRSRVLWYMTGYIKLSGVVDMAYKPSLLNHMLKDDFIYISYKENLRKERDSFGLDSFVNYDICVCGWSIVDIVLGAEIYSGYDTTEIREQIEKKRLYFRDKYREFYDLEVKFDENIFTHYMKSDYVPQKLRSPKQ